MGLLELLEMRWRSIGSARQVRVAQSKHRVKKPSGCRQAVQRWTHPEAAGGSTEVSRCQPAAGCCCSTQSAGRGEVEGAFLWCGLAGSTAAAGDAGQRVWCARERGQIYHCCCCRCCCCHRPSRRPSVGRPMQLSPTKTTSSTSQSASRHEAAVKSPARSTPDTLLRPHHHQLCYAMDTAAKNRSTRKTWIDR